MSGWEAEVPREYTSDHVKVMKLVRYLELSFTTERPVKLTHPIFTRSIPDIIVEDQLVIFVHHIKWHGSATKSKNDEIKAGLLREKNYKVIKFWNDQIKVSNYVWLTERIIEGYRETFKEHMARVGTDLVMI